MVSTASGSGARRTQPTLGPFELIERLGEGAMGQVWRARHIARGAEVAVKVITAGGTNSPLYQGGFKREIQAMASLDHPHIVTVFEHGHVDADDPTPTCPLPLGAPWFALELALRSLDDVEVASWPALRFVLRHILGALAHAHAHGIIHRDLKPGNVLLIDDPAADGTVRMALADFGIAHALDAESRGLVRPTFLGTPSYTPPEQIATAWRDQGPWTDLYALGCLAWRLACGEPPFRGADNDATFALHLAAPLPAFEPRFEVPTGFRHWLRRMLAKLPAERVRHAADAIWQLEQLDDLSERLEECTLRLHDDELRVRPESARAARSAAADAQTVIARAPTAADAEASTLRWSSAPRAAWHRDETSSTPPFRESWRVPDRHGAREAAHLNDIGLGLFGLRAVPFVDRDVEREAIWSALRDVHQRRAPRALVIHGPTGTGTSRLAEWTARRAAEFGLATLLRASHNPTPGPASGLPPMLARHFACTGLSRPQLYRRLDTALGRLLVRAPSARDDAAAPARDATRVSEPPAAARWEAAALTELISPVRRGAPADDVPAVRVSSRAELHFILARILRRVCLHRPAVLWLDDVHWGAGTLTFVQSVLTDDRYRELPLLMLLTVRDDELSARPREAQLLRDLVAVPGVTSLPLRPLSGEAHSELVGELLPLEPALRAHVEMRTAGNPLFAVQLVGSWIERGALVPGATGYALQEALADTLPNSIHDLWSARIERLIERTDPAQRDDVRRALELAAALGVVVGLQEWLCVCELAGIASPDGLLDHLVGASLAVREHHSWRFVHAMLQESLLRSAADGKRLESHHAHCAAALAHLYGSDAPEIAQRRGRHLLAAGDCEGALPPLADAVRHRLRTDDLPAAEQLLELRDQAIAALPDDHLDDAAPRVVGWLLHSELDRRRGDLEAALRWANRASSAHASGEDILAAHIGNSLGKAALAAGDHEQAQLAFEGASQTAETLKAHYETAATTDAADALAETVEALAESLHGRARIAVREGDLDPGQTLAEMARGYFSLLGDRFQSGWCGVLLASIDRLRDDLDSAERHIHEAWAVFEAVGSRAGVAACTNMLAEVVRAHGEFEEAEWLYRRAAAEWRAIGSWDYVMALLNVALVKLHVGNAPEARAMIERVEPPARERNDRFVIALCQLARLATLTRDELDSHAQLLRDARDFLDDTGFVERDVAFLLETASDRLASMSQPTTALELAKLALLQWRELDDADQVERLEQRSRALAQPGR